jgi:asparagine synthase (glutamine-hydrolysing)
MCGIGGYVDPRGALDGRRVLATLATALAHRGPDGEGFFHLGNIGLAHRRLAIIDLSDAGSQPMTVGPATVVFNGEIYNYRELREELRAAGEQFTTSSDTEVLARAYLHWGPRFTERLRGMWAFALADARTKTLLCARDPFGIKPLYYASHQGAFLFASEPQALIRAGVPPRANAEIAAHYLALGVSEHEPACFFAGIIPLAAGASMLVDEHGNRELNRGPGMRALAQGPGTSAADFANTLKESVGLHLRSDVPVGTCLSGGLDSSTVAALASAAVKAAGGPKFAAVTALSSDPRTDEREFAAAVVERCGLDWHTVLPTAEEFIAETDDCIRAQGEPALSPSVYFQYCVMRAARRAGLKVMLDGQGADELLCGYERYIPAWALETAQQAGLVAALRGFTVMARNARPGLRGMTALAAYVLIPWLRGRAVKARTSFLRPQYLASVQQIVERIARSARSLHSARIADLEQFSLPALLRFEDRNSMAHSIEARVPYVDPGVAGCALRLPELQLLQAGFTKYPLRLLAAQELPSQIAWRRAKVGFEPPTGAWLAAFSAALQPEIAASSLLQRLCREVPQASEHAPALQWRLYNLARWQRLFAVEAG